MTEGVPSADLKARVLARIEARDVPSWPRRLAWLAVPVAAAALIFVLVFLRPHQDANRVTENVNQPPPVARTPDRPLSPTPRQERLRQETTMQATAQTGASPSRAAVAQTSVAAPLQPVSMPSDIERMAPPPLGVPSIAVQSLPASDITTPSIAVEPLETIAPIALAPISEGDRQ
jgi:hypothetical protein